jgi:DNA-binding GntR family transcriptional regulator
VAERTAPVVDAIVEELRRQIIDGELQPGERVREEVIAAPFSVSRVPVREALRRLEAEGYVSLTRFQGASVALPSERNALELMQLRGPLEALAARLAAQRRGGEEAERLASVAAEGVRSVDEHDHERHPGLVDEFHELIARASGNEQLELLLSQMRRKVRWVFAADLEHRAAAAWHDHQAIADAVLDGDPEAAERLMGRHVSSDEDWYASRLRARTSVTSSPGRDPETMP